MLALYKNAKYILWKVIKNANRELQYKREAPFIHADARQWWQGLNTIMGYKLQSGAILGSNISLPGLNAFYLCFEAVFPTPLVLWQMSDLLSQE